MSSRARRQILLGLGALFLAPVAGWPGGAAAKRGRERDDDHDEVWRGRLSGEVLPLEEVLQALPPGARERIVEIEFEYEDGIPVYEIEYIDDAGRLVEAMIDARNGTLLEIDYD